MKNNIEKIKKENPEQAEAYLSFIKAGVEDGSYFKDALSWYFFRYVRAICDRTLLIFGAIVAAVIFFFLIQMIEGAFPLVQHVPVFIKAKDESLYFPSLLPLKPREGMAGYDKNITSVDEAVAKYLVSFYVKDREGFDYRKAEIQTVNNKFNRMKTLSSNDEYKNFQAAMSKFNPDSPLNKFGQNVVKTIAIDSVTFASSAPKTFADQAIEFLSVKIPKEAEVRFSATTKTNDGETTKEEKVNYAAKITFDFAGASKDDKSGALDFTITDYKLFKVQ